MSATPVRRPPGLLHRGHPPLPPRPAHRMPLRDRGGRQPGGPPPGGGPLRGCRGSAVGGQSRLLLRAWKESPSLKSWGLKARCAIRLARPKSPPPAALRLAPAGLAPLCKGGLGGFGCPTGACPGGREPSHHAHACDSFPASHRHTKAGLARLRFAHTFPFSSRQQADR